MEIFVELYKFEPKQKMTERYSPENISFSTEERYDALIIQGCSEETAIAYSKTAMPVYITKS